MFLLPSLLFLSTLTFTFATPIAKRQYAGQDTENQLLDGTPCRAITILFARGTTESGNVGTLAGPPFFQAVSNAVGAGNVAVQGVSASRFQFHDSDGGGDESV